MKTSFQTGENDKRKNVILNEVKNLCSWLTFCYDAILHFVQNDRGVFRMTGGEGDEGQKDGLSLGA